MIIESQDGTTIVVMGENSCVEVEEYDGVFELNFDSANYEVTLGKFTEFDLAKWHLHQIMEAYLRGDKQYKVAEQCAELDDEEEPPGIVETFYRGGRIFYLFADGTWNSTRIAGREDEDGYADDSG